MSNAQRVVAGILPVLLIAMALPSTFAETPTPYDEWDFDIITERFTVTQDYDDPKIMNISVPIQYNGEFPTGTTNVDVVVIDPLGVDDTQFGNTRILEIGHIDTVEFNYTQRQAKIRRLSGY